MKTDDRELVLGTARWLAQHGRPSSATSRADDLVAAHRLLEDLAEGREPASVAPDLLHAACMLLVGETDARLALSLAHDLFDVLVRSERSAFAEESADLQSACAFAGWRAARRLRDAAATSHWISKVTALAESTTASHSFEELLDPASDGSNVEKFTLRDPMRMLLVCEWLRRMTDADPAGIRAAAERLFVQIRQLDDEDATEETSFFRGELAVAAGTACRALSRRSEAEPWFDRAEEAFRTAGNETADLARVQYQRLAERLEERHIREVGAAVPLLRETFRGLGMLEDELKCRFLEGLCLMETDELPRAADLFRDICSDAERLGYHKLLTTAQANLAHIYGSMGDVESAIAASSAAIPVLRRINDRVALVKVQWGLAALLRETGHLQDACDAYREARAELDSLGIRADFAAVSLIIADLLLELNEKSDALREISAALPIIEELNMTQERMAALSLLRDSARGQEIDRTALRELSRSLRDPKLRGRAR